MYKHFLKSLKKKEEAQDKMVEEISTHRPHAFQRTHVIFSAENPFHPASLKLSHEEVVKFLKGKGYDVEEMEGKYGGNPERSIMVKNAKRKHFQHFHDLARKLGQDSVIFSDGYNHEMHFLGHDKLGQHAKGQGTDWTDHEPEDNFSRLPSGKYFLHNFNHEMTYGSPSFLNHKHEEEEEIKKGEKKLDYNSHPLSFQHPNVKLVHFSPEQGLKEISPENHGVRRIGAEARQGAPEHKTSFYYLEGVKPESIVTQGSKSKYITSLGNKKLYDISADKDNLFSHAQRLADKRAINPGSVRREDFHQAIRDAGYHGIYNSGLDGTMGHVVAMFEPMKVEKEHKMHQNDFHEVSVKDHHAEDAKVVKFPIHPNFYDWHDGHTDHHDTEEDKIIKKDEKPIGTTKPLQQAQAVAPTNNVLQHPHNNAHGPAEAKPAANEQAGGVAEQSFHNVMQHYGTMNKAKQSNLKFYHNIDHHHDDINKMLGEHGFEHYYAGGQFGKPDLQNKNYNTKHLMIYDPTPQSGGDFGDEKYTDAWRKSHELAHALTYPEVNSIYGEGRRLGKLGVRTPNEMKRAVHWEWLAAHKQRDLMKQLGYHMHDDDFHKELNTVMGDAVHRAVTGKFTEPSEMGFQPHSHKVPLHHALGAIDAAAKELGLEHDHDTTAALNKRRGIAKSEGDVPAPKTKKPKVPAKVAATPKPAAKTAAPKTKKAAPGEAGYSDQFSKQLNKKLKTKAPAAAAPEMEEATPEAPQKSNVVKEQEKVREQLQNLQTDKQSTAGIFSRIYSIPSQDKMARSKTAAMSGQVPSTINVYGSHYPVVRMLDDGKTLLLHTSPYGEEGKTQELVEKIKTELPGVFPEARVVEIHHPDYRHSAKIMRMRDHNNVHKYLEEASKNHPDENYRQHALEALEHLRGGLKKAEYGKPIHGKRTEGEGWDYKQNLDKRMGRLHNYLSKLGLTPDMSDDHGRALGAGGPSSFGINLHGDPHDQQTLHEAAHAMLTPMGQSLAEYQSSIGKPGFQGKITQTQNAASLKATHGGGMPEATAQHMEAGIARRAGVEPFRSPQRGAKADTGIELGRQHAKKTLEMYDEGLQSFDPFTGVNEPGSSIDAVINARARGDKGIFNRVHTAFKARKKAEKENQISHDDLVASEKDTVTNKPFGQHPRDWYKDQAKKKAQSKKLVNGKKQLDAAMDKLKDVKKEEDLQKGSLQRKMGNPKKQTDIQEKRSLSAWANMAGKRDDIPEATEENLKRFLHKLHSQTEVRRHPKTGERLFLMHRGVGKLNDRIPHEFNHTSWTPDYDIARGFSTQDDHDDRPDVKYGKIHSAWIPESAIHNYVANGAHAHGKDHHHEQEYIVKPHKFMYAKKQPLDMKSGLESKISSKAGRTGDKSSYRGKSLKQIKPIDQHSGQFGWQGDEKLAASENDKSDLQKGSLQSKIPFNPKKDVKPDERIKTEGWVEGLTDAKNQKLFNREDVPRLEGNGRVRALNKLARTTEVRKHPKTGERLYLLHRGHSVDEDHSAGNTSWTPHQEKAIEFATDYQGKVSSLWVPESQIHHIPMQIGNTNQLKSVPKLHAPDGKKQSKHISEYDVKDRVETAKDNIPKADVGEPRFKDEHEVIINPHKFIKATLVKKPMRDIVDNKINVRFKNKHDKSKIKARTLEPVNGTFTGEMKEDLAASEKTQTDAIQPEHLDSKLAVLSKPISPRYRKKYGLKKAEGKTMMRAGAIALAMAHGAHYMNQDNKQAAVPRRDIANEEQVVDPNQSAIAQARENALKEGAMIAQKNYVKHNTLKPSPIIIRETIKQHPDLQQKYDFASKMSLPALKELADNHPELSHDIGMRHYDNLKNIFGDDRDQIDHAWKYGIAATRKKFGVKQKQPVEP